MGWHIDDVSWKMVAMSPTWVKERSRSSLRSGRAAGMRDWKVSLKRCEKHNAQRTRYFVFDEETTAVLRDINVQWFYPLCRILQGWTQYGPTHRKSVIKFVEWPKYQNATQKKCGILSARCREGQYRKVQEAKKIGRATSFSPHLHEQNNLSNQPSPPDLWPHLPHLAGQMRLGTRGHPMLLRLFCFV